MNLGLDHKVALVTGSYRGTGSGIAEALAREGTRALVHGFEPGQADPVVERLRAAGLAADPVVGDITTDTGANELVTSVLSSFAGIDILINNYGVAEPGRWLETTTDDWVEIYHKNVLSGIRLVSAFVPGMRERGWGRIVWLGTVGSTRPAARMPHYYASKATLPNLCVSLAKELAGTGITANVVSPGLIATAEVKSQLLQRAKRKGWGEDWETVRKEALRDAFGGSPGCIAEIEEVASLVTYLASEPAAAINGANFRIDGGATDCAF